MNMKKIAYLMFGLITAGMMFFSSCSTDSTTPGDIHPAMNFVGGTGYTSGNATMDVGTIFTVGLQAFSSTQSNAKLVKFNVTRIFENKPLILVDSTINTAQFAITLNIGANGNPGVENFIFTITDADNQSKELSFQITTVAVSGPGPINTFSMKIMGAQGSSTGSSFASIDGTVYSGPDAKTNSSKVDWLYFYGASNLATLAAPDDPDAATIFTNATYGLQTWAVKNPTRFKLVTVPVDWAAVTDDATIVTLCETGVDQSKVNNLDVTNVLAFITATGKKGLIQVEDITGTNAGTMTISVKVQQ
jgi:hypothetical protein